MKLLGASQQPADRAPTDRQLLQGFLSDCPVPAAWAALALAAGSFQGTTRTRVCENMP